MKHLATCSNAGEAGILQSLLAGAGIDSELRDGRSDISGIPSAQLYVSPELHAEASELIAQHQGTEPKKQRAPVHPAEGFPFLGIMGFVAILWSLATMVMTAVSMSSEAWQRLGAPKALLQIVAVGAMALLWGMMIGALVALMCLLAKVTWQKLRADPAASANSGAAHRSGTS